MEIPRFKTRIEALMFKGQYHKVISKVSFNLAKIFQAELKMHCMFNRPMLQVYEELNILEKACLELRSSKKFAKVLQMVLVVGNHLNGGSFRGSASGFKLDVLLKLMDIRGRNKTTTLLHFVLSQLLSEDKTVK